MMPSQQLLTHKLNLNQQALITINNIRNTRTLKGPKYTTTNITSKHDTTSTKQNHSKYGTLVKDEYGI